MDINRFIPRCPRHAHGTVMALKTRCTQMSISSVSQAGLIFGNATPGTCPLVLIPPERFSCSLFLRVPQDAHCVMQVWGRDIDPFAPGLHMLPPWYRVAYLVTKQNNTYNAPVVGCPTADNVKVKIDLSLSFSIDNPRSFVYNLGAMRFDELLQAATEEATRGLVRSTPVEKVYELRGSKADQMLETLKEKFREFGVHFASATITNVELPEQIANSLQQATLYESKTKEQEKSHEFHMTQLRNQAGQEHRKLDINNDMQMKEMTAKKNRSELERKTKITEAERMKSLDLQKAREEEEVMRINAGADVKNSVSKVKRDLILRHEKAQSEVSGKKVAVEQEVKSMRLRSDADFQKCTDREMGRRAEAEAESKAAQTFMEKRAHELSIARLEAIKELAEKADIMVTGDNGDQFLNTMFGAAVTTSL